MNYNKDWLIEEEEEIMRDNKKYKKKGFNNYFLFIFILFLFLIAVAEYCNAANVEPRKFVETNFNVLNKGYWECPKCGYENDNRIRYCSICGSERKGSQ